MMKKSKTRITVVISSVVALLALASLAVLPLSADRLPVASWLGRRLLVQQADEPLTGEYAGSVTLEGVFTGVYSDTTSVPVSIDLGRIDLALHLTQSGETVSGYVNLDRTLVFTQEHTITVTPVAPLPGSETPEPQELAVGPAVRGTYDGQAVRLESEPFSAVLSEERVLPQDGRLLPERRITRQFSLVTTEVQDEGGTLVGTYRESQWGFAAQPSTVVGSFTLQRPIYASIEPPPSPTPTVVRPTPQSTLYLPLISHNPGGL